MMAGRLTDTFPINYQSLSINFHIDFIESSRHSGAG
jgi:hypothetical protein